MGDHLRWSSFFFSRYYIVYHFVNILTMVVKIVDLLGFDNGFRNLEFEIIIQDKM